MEQYSEKVMEHFQNPRNVGEIANADGIGNVGNPICGDILRLYIKVEKERIVDAKFKTFGCLPPREEVVSRDGGWERISSISKRRGVVNNEGAETQVVETYVRRYKGQMLKIIPFVSPYNSFSLTPEHPVLCVKREWLKSARRSSSKCEWLRIDREELLSRKPEYVRAKELRKTDYLIFVFNKTVKDIALFNRETMRLIGYYLSEGYIPGQTGVVAFAFNKNESDLIKELKTLIFKITNKKAKQRIRGNVCEVYVCSSKLARFLTGLCRKGARNKKLSREIMLLPFHKQYEMIKTYLAGDGDMYRRRPKDSQTYRIITTSKSLAIQVQEILARGGIFISIRKIFKTNCVIDGRVLKDSVQYLLSFKLNRKHKFVHPNDGYFLVPIRKIEKRNFMGNVYNFQVSNEPNSYLVKGFAVHNCGAAIATSSMVTELVKGKSVDEAMAISNHAVAEALGGLPKIKMHCSVLAEEALRSAIEDYQKKLKGKSG